MNRTELLDSPKILTLVWTLGVEGFRWKNGGDDNELVSKHCGASFDLDSSLPLVENLVTELRRPSTIKLVTPEDLFIVVSVAPVGFVVHDECNPCFPQTSDLLPHVVALSSSTFSVDVEDGKVRLCCWPVDEIGQFFDSSMIFNERCWVCQGDFEQAFSGGDVFRELLEIVSASLSW